MRQFCTSWYGLVQNAKGTDSYNVSMYHVFNFIQAGSAWYIVGTVQYILIKFGAGR